MKTNATTRFIESLIGKAEPEETQVAYGKKDFSEASGEQGAKTTFTMPSQTDNGNVTVSTGANVSKTVQEYLNSALRHGEEEGVIYVNAKTNEILKSQSQANSVQTASLVAYRGVERDGVDQINPTVNPVLIRNILGRFDLPALISVQPFSVSFNAGGACYANGAQIKPDTYNPAVLSKSFILKGVFGSPLGWPIFGYDIAVRAFSTEVGDAKLEIACYDTTDVSEDSGLDESARRMYCHSYHLTDVNKIGKVVCALAIGNKVLNSGDLNTTLGEGQASYNMAWTMTERARDCVAAFSLNDPQDTYPKSMIKLSGINVILTVTPLVVSKESVARVLNNLDKDVVGYIGALANIRNSDQDKFNY